MANTHSRDPNANTFHGGMRGLMIGAILGALVPFLAMQAFGVRSMDGGSSAFVFFGIAFGGGIGFFIGAIASRRNHQQLAYAYDGLERRASMARYPGVDRRMHR